MHIASEFYFFTTLALMDVTMKILYKIHREHLINIAATEVCCASQIGQAPTAQAM